MSGANVPAIHRRNRAASSPTAGARRSRSSRRSTLVDDVARAKNTLPTRQGAASLPGALAQPLQRAEEIDRRVDVFRRESRRGRRRLAGDVLVDGAVSVAIDGNRTRDGADAILPQELQAPEFGAETVALVAGIAAVEFHHDRRGDDGSAPARSTRNTRLLRPAPIGSDRHDVAPERRAANRAKIRLRRSKK